MKIKTLQREKEKKQKKESQKNCKEEKLGWKKIDIKERKKGEIVDFDFFLYNLPFEKLRSIKETKTQRGKVTEL